MSAISYQTELSQQLNQNPVVLYKHIQEILYAFQVASLQGQAIGKTYALLEFLKSGSVLVIDDFENSSGRKEIKTVNELSEIFKRLDQAVDLTTDQDFQKYFH